MVLSAEGVYKPDWYDSFVFNSSCDPLGVHILNNLYLSSVGVHIWCAVRFIWARFNLIQANYT